MHRTSLCGSPRRRLALPRLQCPALVGWINMVVAGGDDVQGPQFPVPRMQLHWHCLSNNAMEPAGWHCLLYAVVYATSLAALRRARDQFHSVVCGAVGTCFCDRRLAWTLVRSLPMGASVEWQFATSHDASLHEKTVLRGDGSPPARCVLILFKSGAKPPDVNYPIVPV
uniref:Retrotransposon hot spot (RHS) protein n=1 Tax=Mesocestoides corti TaxID=53468 RepID=A0A5K3F2V4_MESCO